MNLNLTGQATVASTIQTRILVLMDRLAERLPVWKKLSGEQKKAWLASGKDPILTITWNLFEYLKKNYFFGPEFENNG